MSADPPTRRSVWMHLLVVALLAAACGSVRPTPSPAATPDRDGPTSTPAAPGPAGGAPFGDLLTLAQGELVFYDPEGAMRPVAGPGEPIELASAARGTIVARTAGQVLHVATVSGSDVESLEWRTIEVDPGVARRPLTEMALSPDATRLAILAADFGSGEPFEVVLVDVGTAATRVVAIDREPNGPPAWLDPSTLLLEVTAGPAGGPFLRLDAGGDRPEGIRAQGYGPALSGDATAVAVLGDEPGVRVLQTSDWLAGAERETGEEVTGSVIASRVAVDATGRRVAFTAEDIEGAPISLMVYARDGRGWFVADQVRGEEPRWFGWLR
jgi:hypothetical protein